MAAIETNNTKSSMHIRCYSLPSTSHPLVSQFEENLNRLKSSEAASSSSSLSHKLNGLQDLHDSTLKLLQLSATQQDLTREFSKKSVDKLLEGFLFLLDIIEAGNYLTLRKKMKQEIRKALRNLQGIMSKDSSLNTLSMLSFLKEAEAVSVSSLETLLRRWSVISKLMMQPKRVACCDSEESYTNEFENADVALKSFFISHNHSSMENFQTYLENLETCIQDLEAGVASLSRNLIRIRVSLLNFFNHQVEKI
ncbi:hypothetical protein K1719_005398 [Acacia pycnantha]|nr:hypothetical protein K1719_005398 [Acacia pycnantha]